MHIFFFDHFFVTIAVCRSELFLQNMQNFVLDHFWQICNVMDKCCKNSMLSENILAIFPRIFRHSWEIWKISCVKVEGCRSMASASIPLTDFVKSSKFCGNPSVPWARSRQRKLAPTLWLKLGNVICSSYTIRTIWRKGLASVTRWDKYLSFVSCFSQLFLDINMNCHVQQDRKHTQQSTLKAVSGKNLTTFFGQSSKHSLSVQHTDYVPHCTKVLFSVFCRCCCRSSLCVTVLPVLLWRLCGCHGTPSLLHLFVMATVFVAPADGPLSCGTHFCSGLVTCHEKADWVAPI